MRYEETMKRFLLIILSLLALVCFGACTGEKPPEKQKYTVVVTQNIAEAGSTVGAGEYDENDTVTLVATTSEGYLFLGWYEGETRLSAQSQYTFLLTADRTIEAKWMEEEEDEEDDSEQGWGSGIW